MALAVTPANVRDLINTALTTKQLSDATINRSVYAGRAVIEVKGRDPDYATRTDDEETRLNIALDNLTAAYIARKMPWLVGEDHEGEGGYRAQATDVDALIAELLGTASEMIGAVTEAETPTHFTVATGTRGL